MGGWGGGRRQNERSAASPKMLTLIAEIFKNLRIKTVIFNSLGHRVLKFPPKKDPKGPDGKVGNEKKVVFLEGKNEFEKGPVLLSWDLTKQHVPTGHAGKAAIKASGEGRHFVSTYSAD